MRNYTNKVLAIVAGMIFFSCDSKALATQEPLTKHEASINWITPALSAPRLYHRTFDSAAADTKVSYHIHIPELYDKEKERHFPVLYWLHGRDGGLKGLPRLVEHFDLAIREGKIPPMLIVFPNGMPDRMWCDSKDGQVPVETVVVKELIPHIDATFRTIPSREGRIIEGFSMGGYGAARLGLKYHNVFGTVSILGAGPMQREFTPSVGPRNLARKRATVLQSVYGGDQAYFKAQSPWELAEKHAKNLRDRSSIRQAVGSRDGCLEFNRDFHEHLTNLQIPHAFQVADKVGHNPLPVFEVLGETNWEFYRTAFGRFAVEQAKTPQPANSQPKTRLLAVGKSKAADPARQQERAADAVRKVTDAAKEFQPDIAIYSMSETIMTKEQFWGGEVEVKVNGAIFTKQLQELARTATAQDTVILYTHSHGSKASPDSSKPPAGIILDPARHRPETQGIFTWNEYADLLLKIPAKNVVVLTMSCFSGGLVECLESPEVKTLWEKRRKEEGRNLIVITSQNKELPSTPIVKDGEIINPFTYAVAKAFVGEADGFKLVDGKPVTPETKDGKLTAGELIDYILYTTEKTHSESAMPLRKNTAEPQLTGSFKRTDVLLDSGKDVRADQEDRSIAQQDAAEDADKPRR